MSLYIGNNDGKALPIKGIYIGDANGKAKQITKAYIGDASGKAKNAYTASLFTFSGNWEELPANNTFSKMFLLTSSGTLSINNAMKGYKLFLVSGGGGGGKASTSLIQNNTHWYIGGGGGGGGIFNSNTYTSSNKYLVSIGSGGGYKGTGGITKITDLTGNVIDDMETSGGQSTTDGTGGDGASGGGGGMDFNSAKSSLNYDTELEAGTGLGYSTVPFALAANDEQKLFYCSAGGSSGIGQYFYAIGAANSYKLTSYDLSYKADAQPRVKGSGGSNGGDGQSLGRRNGYPYTGTATVSSAIMVAPVQALTGGGYVDTDFNTYPATFYGSGGAGGCISQKTDASSATIHPGSAGYQGAVYLGFY